ncbi:MAG: hypothetical protein K0R02_65 [Rickettsiaceae bacterium]|jgi:hypothetical protein|nr:hypothetical protein [Rickettsiaceae bacterium]
MTSKKERQKFKAILSEGFHQVFNDRLSVLIPKQSIFSKPGRSEEKVENKEQEATEFNLSQFKLMNKTEVEAIFDDLIIKKFGKNFSNSIDYMKELYKQITDIREEAKKKGYTDESIENILHLEQQAFMVKETVKEMKNLIEIFDAKLSTKLGEKYKDALEALEPITKEIAKSIDKFAKQGIEGLGKLDYYLSMVKALDLDNEVTDRKYIEIQKIANDKLKSDFKEFKKGTIKDRAYLKKILENTYEKSLLNGKNEFRWECQFRMANSLAPSLRFDVLPEAKEFKKIKKALPTIKAIAKRNKGSEEQNLRR